MPGHGPGSPLCVTAARVHGRWGSPGLSSSTPPGFLPLFIREASPPFSSPPPFPTGRRAHFYSRLKGQRLQAFSFFFISFQQNRIHGFCTTPGAPCSPWLPSTLRPFKPPCFFTSSLSSCATHIFLLLKPSVVEGGLRREGGGGTVYRGLLGGAPSSPIRRSPLLPGLSSSCQLWPRVSPPGTHSFLLPQVWKKCLVRVFLKQNCHLEDAPFAGKLRGCPCAQGAEARKFSGCTGRGGAVRRRGGVLGAGGSARLPPPPPRPLGLWKSGPPQRACSPPPNPTEALRGDRRLPRPAHTRSRRPPLSAVPLSLPRKVRAAKISVGCQAQLCT